MLCQVNVTGLFHCTPLLSLGVSCGGVGWGEVIPKLTGAGNNERERERARERERERERE